MNACTRCGLAHDGARPCPVAPALPTLHTGALLPAGAVVGGRFRIEKVAHRSGMSTVYLAADLRNQCALVALKELNTTGLPREERTEALAWLAREAGLLSVLSDPRLPKLLAAADEGDRHYIAMPFIQGETLEQRVAREGPQPETLVLGWGRELADLLRYLHGQDPPVIHRDLKPANVLLRPNGALALLDLGVARVTAGSPVGTAVGTPGYAPPEQYQGLADERSDLYALGATLHRALTGYNPEKEEPFRHPPIRDGQPEVGLETAALVGQLLRIEPERRPASARVVFESLATAMRGAFAQAYRPVHVMYRRMLTLLALALVLSAAIYGWAFGAPIGGAAFKEADPGGDALRVLAVFAPGLLVFLPLLSTELSALARRHTAPRLHRARAARLVALAWGVPLAVWLLDLYDQRLGNLEAVPGHSAASLGLALGAVLLTALGLVALRHDLRRLRARVVRLRWRFLAGGALLILWPISLALQMPAFAGSCYSSATQTASESQFGAVRALAQDARGDIYVLDQYGLRERTPDNAFHYLLSFLEKQSPWYSATVYTMLAVGPDGRIFLGADGDPWIYELRGGVPVRLVTAPSGYAALAAGRGGVLYLSYPRAGRILTTAPLPAATPGTERSSITLHPISVPLPAPAYRVPQPFWEPEGLAVDGVGSVYFIDARSRRIEKISPAGIATLATVPPANPPDAPLPLARGADDALYTAIGAQIFAVQPGGATATMSAGDGYDAVSTIALSGATIYVGVANTQESLFSNQSDPGGSLSGPNAATNLVDGSDMPAQHCVAPRT